MQSPIAELNQSLPLQTLSESGQAPVKRVKDAEEARQLAQRIIRANQNRSIYNAKIKGMIDGNPPYSAAKLRNAGQSYRANVNFLEGKASLCAALVPYYDLFAGADKFAQVRTDYGNDLQREEWSQIITEEFDWLLRSYDGFDYNMQAMLHDRVAFGKGFLMWPDATDWRFEWIPHYRVLVPDGAECFVNRLEVFMVRKAFSVDELWRAISDRKRAERIGWKPDAVVAAIQNAMPEIPQTYSTQTNYMLLQQKMKDNDLTFATRSATVQAAIIYIKEFDGRITQCIVPENKQQTTINGHPVEVSTEYLYERQGRFQKFNQTIATFFLETLDGSWNGAGGIGRDIYSAIEVKNRLKCQTIDNAFLRAGIVLQAKSADALQKTELVQVGVLNIIPPDYDIQQGTIMADINGLLEVDRSLEMMLSSNTGVYRQRMEQPSGNPRTAEEVRLQYQSSAVLSNSAVNRFYLDLDKFYAEEYRRASNPNLIDDGAEGNMMAMAFQDRCKKRGVPAVALLKIKSVRAMRNIGNGSPFMRQQSFTQTMPLLPMLPETGRAQWITEAIASMAGQEAAMRWNPQMQKTKLPDDQQAMAMLENAALNEGAPVLWTPSQNNVIHAQTHLQAMAQGAESLQQGGNPNQVAMFLEQAGQHVATHLARIANDPSRKQVYQVLSEQFLKIAGFADDLMKQIQQQSEAEQKQQQEEQQAQIRAQAIASGQDPDTAIKAAEAAAKIKLQQEKTAAGIQMKEAKHRQSMAIADATAAAKITRENVQR